MRRAALRLMLAGSLLQVAAPASAQDGVITTMQKGVDFRASTVSSTTTFASGLVTRTSTRSLFPMVTLRVDSLIYPKLRLNAGGVFELTSNRTDVNGVEADSTITRNRPFFLLRSTDPVLSPGFGYFRREERARTAAGSDVKLVNDEYAAYLGWNPAGGPRSDFQFVRTHTFDGDRAFQDVTRQFGTILSDYTYRNLDASYRGSFLDTDDRRESLRTRQTIHSGRISDSETFLENRLLWNGTYNINRQNVRTVGTVTDGEVAVPVRASGGLAAISDLPATARLTPNPALVDDDLTASAGIDIGLVAPGGDPQARNIGLDFLNRTEIDRLLVWVDRDLPFEVARSFSWEIHSSLDNITWRREATVATAPFGPFERRFEIDFPPIVTRYVKVVTTPLSVVVPESSRWPDIFVTEMQAFLERSAAELRQQPAETAHVVNTDVRFRILDAPSLYYEGFYLYNGPNAFGASTSTLSNGFSASQSFWRIFSAYGRVAREQGHEPLGRRTAGVANATLTVEPIPTFRSSLLYTGQHERIAGLPTERQGLFIQNTAQVYRGVNVLFGLGWNQTMREDGESTRDRLVNISGTIVPREQVSLTFSYDSTRSTRVRTVLDERDRDTQRLYATISVDPIRTLHVVLGEEVIVTTGQQTRRTHDVNVNWAPFPDGMLQIIFAYNEALRALEFGRDRSTLGAVRWNVSRRSYIDLSFQRTRSEFVFQKTESRIVSISVRLFA